jgi:membrane-bound lytic murein transglycosylase D
MKISSRVSAACILLSSIFLLTDCATQSAPLALGGNLPAAESTTTPDRIAELPSNSDESAEPAVAASSVPVPVPERSASTAKKETADDDQTSLDNALELTETAQEYWEDNDIEHAIESLDQAYGLILSVSDNVTNPKLAQEKEDIRFMISKRIIEMYASRQATCKGTSNEIPMVMNEHVKREIQSFQTLERDFFIESYRRSGRYRPTMVKALKEAGIPEDISWLPLIESGFKTKALSRARAFGLWQFIPSTGYKYGLKRND